MALSNWDTLAFSIDGPCEGHVINHIGVSIELYKNWLYVRDPTAWVVGRSFVEPVVMQIESGTVKYGGWDIDARRGPQNGVYVVATSQHYHSEYPKDTPFEDRYTDQVFLVGCGVSGYESIEEVYHDEIAAALEGLGFHIDDPAIDQQVIICGGSTNEGTDDDYRNTIEILVLDLEHPLRGRLTEVNVPGGIRDMEFVGVQPDSVAFLQAMITQRWMDPEYPHWPENVLREIDFSAALRFNQGDLFFTKHVGVELSTTVPGEAQNTILQGLIEQMKDDEDH